MAEVRGGRLVVNGGWVAGASCQSRACEIASEDWSHAAVTGSHDAKSGAVSIVYSLT